MDEPTFWSIEHDVREDATRLFVRDDLLPDAVTGDIVDVVSTEPRGTRRGRVIEEIDDAERGRFLTVSFEDGD